MTAPLTIRRLDAAGRSAWDQFVHETCAEASFFHLSGWKEVIEGAFGQTCHFLYAERDGAIAGVLPLVHVKSRLFGDRLIATAFTIGGGVAALDDAARDALDAEALRLMRELRVEALEYRRSAHHEGDPLWHGRSDIYANFARPIAPSEEECLLQIPRKQRAVVRKALSIADLQVSIEDHPTLFFPLYGFAMRNMGTPVFGMRFFRLLMAEFRGRCDCLTVSREGRPLASVLSFYFRDAVMPYYTGSLPEARAVGANDLMYWRLMRCAAARGYRSFDFGRSKFDTGPFEFKKNWGFTPEPIRHEFVTADGAAPTEMSPKNPKFRLFIAGWKKLPLILANRLGPMVIREIG